jgi:hypothetical protein
MTMFDRSLNGTQSKNNNHHVHVRDATLYFVDITLPFTMSSSPPPADAPTATLPADTPPAVQSVPVPVDIPVESHPSSPQISPLPTGAEPETSRTYQLGPATHADSNSATFVQPVKKLSKLSDTQKASQKLR